jgi:hypothetical protein
MQIANLKLLRASDLKHYYDTQKVASSSFADMKKVRGFLLSYLKIGSPLLKGLFEKLSRDLLTLDRKECRFVTELLISNCELRRHLHIMDSSETAMCRKCEQKSSCHIIFSA